MLMCQTTFNITKIQNSLYSSERTKFSHLPFDEYCQETDPVPNQWKQWIPLKKPNSFPFF